MSKIERNSCIFYRSQAMTILPKLLTNESRPFFFNAQEQRNVSSSTDSYNSDPSVQRKRREFVARRFAKCDQESLSEAEVVGTTQYVRT